MDNGGRPCSALEIIPDASAVYYEPVMNNQSIWATRVDYRTLRGHSSKHGGRSGSAIEIIPDASPVYYEPAVNDQSIWATEEDYRAWSGDTSMDGRQPPSQSQSWAEGEQPPSKKLRGYSVGDSGPSSKSKVLGGMLFKSKLCCKFRDGTCPYITNCNFAHGMEELRKQEIVAAHEEDSLLEPREEHKIPILTSPAPAVDGQRSHKARHCKRFYTEEGCPYGDVCTFVHDERFKARERVAISLLPSVGGEDSASGASGLNQKPSNWKTRICKKWEMTGSCPFGSKCHFAHGSTELLRYGGGLVEMEARDASVAMHDPKQSGASSMKLIADAVVAPNTSVPHAEVPGQSSTVVNQRQDQRPLQKWEGTDKISQFYADLIDDNE